MYLSRVKLDEARRSTMIALSNPELLHGAISQSFSGERPFVLWRLDRLSTGLYLLVLSEEQSALDQVVKEYGIGDAVETKSYDQILEKISEGSLYRFRLKANPTYSMPRKDEESGKLKRGRICAHSTIPHQRQWLTEQGQKHGFSVTEDSFDVTETRWYKFTKGKSNKLSILSVTFEGVLNVTDADAFREAMTKGIGRGKAYGMGLLTIMKAE